jgi:hypothetical protein
MPTRKDRVGSQIKHDSEQTQQKTFNEHTAPRWTTSPESIRKRPPCVFLITALALQATS